MEPGVGREEEENRGKGRSGGEAGREGGTQRRRREEGAWEEGRGLRRGPGGGGDRFVYGQWGEGRGRRAEPGEGGASLPSFPAWDSVVALPSCRVAGSPQLFSSCCLRRPSPTSSRSPGEAGCPFLLLQLADPGRRPVTQSPLRDMGRKRQLLGVGPALPITRRSSPCFFFFFFLLSLASLCYCGGVGGCQAPESEANGSGSSLSSQRFTLSPTGSPIYRRRNCTIWRELDWVTGR